MIVSEKVGFSVEFKDEHDTVVCYPDMESLMDWWHGTTHGLFKPELIDADALKSLKETYKSEKLGKTGTLIMSK